MGECLKKLGLVWLLLSVEAQAQEPVMTRAGTQLVTPAPHQEPVLSVAHLPEDAPVLIGRYVSFWETGSEKPTDEEVLRGDWDSRFHISQQELPGRGFIHGMIWLRIIIENSSEQPQTLFLDSRYPVLDFLTLFQKDAAGVYQREIQGDAFAERIGYADYRHPSFKMQVAPGRNVYYLKMVTEGSAIIALYLSKPEAHRHHQMFDMAVVSLFFGVMITLLLYNSFLTLSFRSVTYLYYSLFLLSMLMTQVALQGFWPMILPGAAAAYAQNTGILLCSCTTFLTAALVTISFLNMREHMPRSRLFFIGFIWCSIILFVLAFFVNYSTHIKVTSGFILLGSLAMAFCSALAVYRGYRPAFSYSFAWIFMIVSNIILYLTIEGISHIPMFVQWGNMPGVILEGILMSLALGDRVNFIRAKAERTIHELNEELQNHLKKVEAQVHERTETIRTIVDNVTSGFLVINREGLVGQGYTRSCRHLIGCDINEGTDFIAALDLRPSVKKKFRMALAQVFEDSMPLDVSLQQLPNHVLTRGRYLHIDAAGLRDRNGKLHQLLLTLNDATELRKRKNEAYRNRSLLKILRDIEGFRQFIAYSHEAVQKLKLIEDGTSREIYFTLHTLKGNCLVFHLPDMARALHVLEDKPEISRSDIDRLEEQFKTYLTRHASLLRTSWGPANHEKRVTDKQLQTLLELVGGNLNSEVKHWIQEVSAKPVRTILQPLIQDACVVARKLNKEVDVRVIDRDARVHSEDEELLIEELIHIVRNAIVHGIEEDREAVQKPERGWICLEFNERGHGLTISCTDDGRGFDRRIWETEWIKRGYPVESSIHDLPLVELVDRISRGGFSTQEKVSLFAGRGIGIEALFEAVDRCGGTVKIFSERGQGSRFEIFLPRSQALRSAS